LFTFEKSMVSNIFFPLAAGTVKKLSSLSFLVLRPSYIVHSSAGAGLGQELGYWTVPAPGVLFITGSRFWTIIDTAQDRTGKVLALRWWVGWYALIQDGRPGTTSTAFCSNCRLKPAKGFLRLSKKLSIDYASKPLPDRLALRSSFAGRRHNLRLCLAE
jgi:hypothetical protein